MWRHLWQVIDNGEDIFEEVFDDAEDIFENIFDDRIISLKKLEELKKW